MIKMRLVRLLDHAKKYIVYTVFWQWLALLAQIVVVFSIAGFLENVLYQKVDSTMCRNAVFLFLFMTAVRFICEKMSARASYQASADVKRILRSWIYEKLLRLGVSYREQTSTSEIVQISTEGVEQLETYFGRYLPQLFYSLLAPLTLFAVLSFTSLKASAVLLICVPLIPVSIVIVQKIAKKLLNRYWGIYTSLGDSFLENLQGLTTLKIYQADDQKAQAMDKEAQHFRRITMKVLTMQLNSTSVMDMIAYGGAAVGMIVATNEFLCGRLEFSGTLAVILLASEFFIPLRLLGSFFHIAMNGMAASDKIFRLLDLPEKENGTKILDDICPKNGKLSQMGPKGQKKENGRSGFDISMTEVHFSYDTEREILKGISLEIPEGSFVSLVGESGCGKSTIAGLIAGKNKGFTGGITIGGISVSEIREDNLMEHLTVISHNSYLFKGTVEDNLRMAKKDATIQEMKDALGRVNLWDFLKNQQGLQTVLLEKAENLSGGQRQRLALARALLHDTSIYIFDEATSNIDAESEEQIMKVIRELSETKTVLLISHRLSNVVDSDYIYMLADGEIREAGKHKELMEQKGSYQRLYHVQKQLENYGGIG